MIATYRSFTDKNGSYRELLWLLFASFVIIAIGIGLRSPWPADEPRFALIALEMVNSGEWLFPHRGGELYPDKPPVFVWMQAIFYLLTGSMQIAFLLPSLLGALVCVALIYDLAQRFYGQNSGRNAVILLLCTIQFMVQAKLAQIDMTVCMWITIGNYALLRHFLQGPCWKLYYLGWFAMGLGVITKGVGFLPILLCLPYIWLLIKQEQCRFNIKSIVQHSVGLIVMLLAIALWVGPMYYAVEVNQDASYLAYRDNIMLRQTAERYVNSLGHQKPFYYYIVSVIPLFWLPLSILLPWLAPRWFKAIKNGDRLVFLTVIWAILVLLFFSNSPGKRGVYILPIVPMLVLIAAPYLDELTANIRIRAIAWVMPLAIATTLISSALISFFFMPQLLDKLPTEANATLLCIIALGGAFLLPTLYWRVRNPIRGAVISLALGWGIYSVFGYWLMEPTRSPKDMMAEINTITGPQSELAIINFKEQLLLHSERDVVQFGFHTLREKQTKAAAKWLSEGPEKRWVLSPAEHVEKCFNEDSWIDVDTRHRRTWVLVQYSDLLDREQLINNGCDDFTQTTIPLYHAKPVFLTH
ncbi:glycosyltransferase family 39 protein [Psychromonas sp. MME2]|uniref:ArnT family glycosyltransferase n=1 Tax=unclassified Psychromonas TaxID=2614957 RepID=UPI00339C9874